ncbi:MAG: hypothetical protein HQL27_03910 [Candidatus Omnitrophica bacterium]|nr:hypothetical protein [Candidatus Omnitrophota bacterium]
MIKRILLSIVLIFLSNFSYAGDKSSLRNECFSLEGLSEDKTKLIEAVFNQLKSSGIVPAGFPLYSKTAIVGEDTNPHTFKAVPVASAELADSILISEGKFITFMVWGANTKPFFATDFVYLLKERDEDAIRNGFKGLKRYKYIAVEYQDLLPVMSTGRYGGDFSQANKIKAAVQQGLLKSNCKKVRCD